MADKDVIYLTGEWLQNLKAELQFLKEVKRVEIAEKLKEAISFWDLSENAEYEEARNEQAQVEIRISDVEEQLKKVKIIKEDSKWDDRINMGALVTILNISENETQSYKIVGSAEATILGDMPKISNESPVGKVLIGKRKWDVVKVVAPSGTFEYKVLNIK
jgi:transcription elongation factor GreA